MVSTCAFTASDTARFGFSRSPTTPATVFDCVNTSVGDGPPRGSKRLLEGVSGVGRSTAVAPFDDRTLNAAALKFTIRIFSSTPTTLPATGFLTRAADPFAATANVLKSIWYLFQPSRYRSSTPLSKFIVV